MTGFRQFSKMSKKLLYGKRRNANVFGSDRNFIGVKFFLPRAVYKLLIAFRSVKGIPIARLVAIAVYNEIRKPDPFYLKTEADTPFEPNKHANGAAKIFRYLQDNKGGMAKDLLLMCKDALDMHDEDTFLHSLQELLNTGMAEEVFGLGGSSMPWIQVKHYSGDDLSSNRT